MAQQRPILTLTEAAAAFGVSRFSIARWLDGGRLPFVELPSGRRVVLRTTVDEILDDGRLAGARPA